MARATRKITISLPKLRELMSGRHQSWMAIAAFRRGNASGIHAPQNINRLIRRRNRQDERKARLGYVD